MYQDRSTRFEKPDPNNHMAVVSTGCKKMTSKGSTKLQEMPQNIDPSFMAPAYNTWATDSAVSMDSSNLLTSSAEEPTMSNPSSGLHLKHCQLNITNCSSCFCNIGSL